MDDPTFEQGLAARRRVLGDEYVDAAIGGATELDEVFQRWVTTTAWAGPWSRDTLDDRTRTLVTVAILAALGREELAIHLAASRNTGATPEELVDVMLHVGVYAGVPAAVSGMKRLRAVLGEDG